LFYNGYLLLDSLVFYLSYHLLAELPIKLSIM
jgi:hypothetical protein